MRALAIDDDLVFLRLLETCLKQINYTTKAILEADEVLTAIAHETYHLVLVDWMTPGVDVITVIKAIRSRDKQTGNKTKVVMTAAIDNTIAKNYARRSGTDGFLPKLKDEDNFKLGLLKTISSVMSELATR